MVAQAIPIIITPILTRLYSPADFGVYGIFIAIISIFGSIAGGRYELAIVLPKRHKDAVHLVAIGLFINIVVSATIFIIIVIFHNDILNLIKNDDISFWLYIAPFAVLLTGFFNILNYFNVRIDKYKDISKALMYKSLIMALFQVFIGILYQGASGLISGAIISSLFSNIKLFKNYLNSYSLHLISISRMIVISKRYVDFVKYSMPSVLVNSLTIHLTNILLSIVFSVAALGNYILVQKIVGLPAKLISQSISQVFYKEAVAEKKQKGDYLILFKNTQKKLILIGIPVFIIIALIMPDLFSMAFGTTWRIAGEYAQIVSPLFFFQFVVGPLTVVNQINLNNIIGMFWQLGLLFFTLLILYIAYMNELNFKSYLIMISVILSIYYILYIIYLNMEVKKSSYSK